MAGGEFRNDVKTPADAPVALPLNNQPDASALPTLDLTDFDETLVDSSSASEAPNLSTGDNPDDPFASLPEFATAVEFDSSFAASTAVGESGPAGAAVDDVASAEDAKAGGKVKKSKQKVAASGQESTANSTDAVPAEVPRRKLTDRLVLRSMPSWLASMMLHVALLMMLAAVQIEPVSNAIGVLLTASAGEEITGLDEEFDLRGPQLDAPAAATVEATSVPSEFSSQDLALPDASSLSPMEASVDVGKISNMVESILPSSGLGASASRISSSLSGRGSSSLRSEMLERFGGNAASEKSVALALKWISEHQDRSGGWSFGHSRICRGQCKDDGDLLQATNAATALALLPFLGAGQTHLEGNYKTTVHNGLKFLINRMKVTGSTLPTGSWHEEGGSMYSHGLASIVVCEAYAMTRDPDLLQPAQLALNYINFAQDPRGGGWRYSPKQPGDTSVVGWQLMAMKSGVMGNLTVPNESFRLASSFLDSMSVNQGAYYGYDQPTSNIEGRQATTAVGLLCRMYLGWSKDNPGLKEGVKYLSDRGPKLDDLYFSYYATQVLRQYGGDEWNKWNKAMRDGLIKSQATEGHAAGSWFSAKGHNIKGGRLYCTAMSTMIVEVYYRHLPLYSDKSSDEEFEF